MGPSIGDVARFAGVGKGTVSRVLNDQPGVSDKTAKKVRDAIQKLGYTPNVQARRLARSQSDLICFVLSNRDFLHEFHSVVLKGVERFCSEAGRDVVFALWRYRLDPPPVMVTPPRIIAGRGSVDGVVLAGANHVECIKAVAQMGVPCVTFGNNLVGCASPTEVDSVWYDESTGTREGIRYLVKLGHRRIGFVGSPAIPWFARNYRAYAEAVVEMGLEPIAVPTGDAQDDAAIGENAVEAILASDAPVTAVFAGNDYVALSAMRAFARRGVRVPRDVSVMGFDDSPRSQECDPGLTTIRVPTEELGAECARFLLEKIAGGDSATGARVIPTSLVIRDSCSAVRNG